CWWSSSSCRPWSTRRPCSSAERGRFWVEPPSTPHTREMAGQLGGQREDEPAVAGPSPLLPRPARPRERAVTAAVVTSDVAGPAPIAPPPGPPPRRPVPSLSLEFLATRRLLLRQLKSLPLFAGCGSRVALAARWGEVVGAMTGDVLAIENSSAHWFFFVLTGTVDVGRRGEPVATLHRGDYFGERDIVAFA